jgi:hypothetical protein
MLEMQCPVQAEPVMEGDAGADHDTGDMKIQIIASWRECETPEVHPRSTWEVEVLRRCIEPPSAPRLIAVCYNQTGVGVEITRAMIESIYRYTPAPHELWIVDNASPPEYSDWLRSVEDVNVVFNHTPPVPSSQVGWRVRLGLQRLQPGAQMNHGSYANGIGLELGAWAIDPNTEQVFVMRRRSGAT